MAALWPMVRGPEPSPHTAVATAGGPCKHAARGARTPISQPTVNSEMDVRVLTPTEGPD